MVSRSRARSVAASHRLSLGWVIAIDVAGALGFWSLMFFNQFPAPVVHIVPIAYLLIAIPLAIRRSTTRATSPHPPL